LTEKLDRDDHDALRVLLRCNSASIGAVAIERDVRRRPMKSFGDCEMPVLCLVLLPPQLDVPLNFRLIYERMCDYVRQTRIESGGSLGNGTVTHGRRKQFKEVDLDSEPRSEAPFYGDYWDGNGPAGRASQLSLVANCPTTI
jgi:hypothetical protein